MVREYTSKLGRKIFSPVLPFRCSLVSEGSCDFDGALPAELRVFGVCPCPVWRSGWEAVHCDIKLRPVGSSVTGAIDGGRREKSAIMTIAALVIPSY